MNYIKQYDEFNIYGESVSTSNVFEFVSENLSKNPKLKMNELIEKAIQEFEWNMPIKEINEIVSAAFRTDHSDISE